MPRVSDILPLLNAKTVAKFATVSKTLSKVSRHRLANVKSRKTVTSHQAAKIGRARYKTTKKNQNLNEIYNSLNRVGLANRVEEYKKINKFIEHYENALNVTLTGKQHERLIRKMKKWKSELKNEIVKRTAQRNNLRMNNLFNMSSQGTTPPTPENRYWR